MDASVMTSHSPITVATEDKMTETDMLVCGRCNSTFEFFDDYKDHLQNVQNCISQLQNKLNFKFLQEQICQVWGFLTWKNSQEDTDSKNSKGVTNDPKTWNMYQKWRAMSDQERAASVLADKNLKACKSLSNAKKLQNLEEIKSHDKPVGSTNSDGSRKPLDNISNNVKTYSRNKSTARNNDRSDPEIREKLVELMSARDSTTSPFVLEKVLARRYNRKTKQCEYLIKWKDFLDDQNTWEPADKLKPLFQFAQNFGKLRKLQQQLPKKINDSDPLSSVTCSGTSGMDLSEMNKKDDPELTVLSNETITSNLDITPYKPAEIIKSPEIAVPALIGHEYCKVWKENDVHDELPSGKTGADMKPVFRKSVLFKSTTIEGRSIIQSLAQNSEKVENVEMQYELDNSNSASFATVKKIDASIPPANQTNDEPVSAAKVNVTDPSKKRQSDLNLSPQMMNNTSSRNVSVLKFASKRPDGTITTISLSPEMFNNASGTTPLPTSYMGVETDATSPITPVSSKFSAAGDLDETSDFNTPLMLLSHASDIAAIRRSKGPFTKKFPSRSGTYVYSSVSNETYTNICATTYQPLTPKSTPAICQPSVISLNTAVTTTVTSVIGSNSPCVVLAPLKKRITSSYGYTDAQTVTPSSKSLLPTQWWPISALSNNSESSDELTTKSSSEHFKTKKVGGRNQQLTTSSATAEKCVGVTEDMLSTLPLEKCVGVTADMFSPLPSVCVADRSEQSTISNAPKSCKNVIYLFHESSVTTSIFPNETGDNYLHHGTIMLRDAVNERCPNLLPSVNKSCKIAKKKKSRMLKKRVVKYSKPLNRYLCRSKCNFRFGAIYSLNRINEVNSTPIPNSILSKTLKKLKSSRLKVAYFKNANKIIPPVPDLIPIAASNQKLKYEKFPVESFHLNPVLFPPPKRRGRPPKRKLGDEIENKIIKSPAKNVEKKRKKSPAKNVRILPKTKVSTLAKSAIASSIPGLSRILKAGLSIEPVQTPDIKIPLPKCYKGAPRYECNRSMTLQPLELFIPDGNKVDDLPEDLNYGPLSPRSTFYSLDPKTGVRLCKAAGSNLSGRSSYSNQFKTAVLPDGSQITSHQDILEIIPLTRYNDVITERGQEERKLGGSYRSMKTPLAKKANLL